MVPPAKIFPMIRGFLLSLLFVQITSCNDRVGRTTQISKPNVVLIIIDDLGWKDLGFMGSPYYETPHLDAFAKEGMQFSNAYASAANCAPSRACMLTGQHSPRHGVYTVGLSARGNSKTRKLVPIENTNCIDNDVFTLPDMFKANGYVTGSFGKWHIGEDPTLQGIDVNVGGSARGNPGSEGYFSPYHIDHISNGPSGEYLTDRLTDEAIDFLTTNKKKPFFLYLPFYTVHTPLMAKDEVLKKFERKKGGLGQNNPTYAAMISIMDENIGRLLSHLEMNNLAKNTLVMITSDNGGIRAISSQTPLRAGKGSYYEGGIRVPLVVRWPGHIQPASHCASPVSNLDFFPTMQTIIHSKEKVKGLDGTDITPLFRGQSIEDRDLFWHFPIYLEAYDQAEDDGRDPLFRTRPGTVMISGSWKLHEYYEDMTLELYNITQDLGERNNLINKETVIAAKMHNRMQQWRDATGAQIPHILNPEYDSSYNKTMIIRQKEIF